MTDIVERLRKSDDENTDPMWLESDRREAADEIERNREAIAELVEALKLALEELETDWHTIDSEWGPSGFTLDEEVANGSQPAIAAVRAALSKHDTTTKGN